jgi:hypothetical protein
MSRAALAWRRRDSDPRLRAFIAIARQHLRRGRARSPACGQVEKHQGPWNPRPPDTTAGPAAAASR